MAFKKFDIEMANELVGALEQSVFQPQGTGCIYDGVVAAVRLLMVYAANGAEDNEALLLMDILDLDKLKEQPDVRDRFVSYASMRQGQG